MNIAERIKKLREIYGITSNEFAEITGIHPVSIRKYETNKMVPGIDIIDKMCDALKLPRMIFEGFPKQHTDYRFPGDFYQQLFLLIDNKTLSVEAKNPDKIVLSPDLKKYIKLTQGDREIPLDELTIEIKHDDIKSLGDYGAFISYLNTVNDLQRAQTQKRLTDTEETREERIIRLAELVETLQCELMLSGHSWRQHMEGWTADSIRSGLEVEIKNGGDYYTYLDKMNIPESEKLRFVSSYEDAYISECIDINDYPGDQNAEAKSAWTKKKAALIMAFKEAHPDYPEMARIHAKENADKMRKH